MNSEAIDAAGRVLACVDDLERAEDALTAAKAAQNAAASRLFDAKKAYAKAWYATTVVIGNRAVTADNSVAHGIIISAVKGVVEDHE